MSWRVSMICFGSRPAVGSSRIRTSGLWMIAWARPDALAVSFGQLTDQLRGNIGDGASLGNFSNAPGRFGFGDPFQPGDEVEVFVDLHVRIERRRFGQIADAALDLHGLIRDIETGDFGAAFGGWQKAGQDAHGCRLTGAVGPEEADDFPLVHGEGDVVDRGRARVALGQTFDGNHSCTGLGMKRFR
jgi:hypothetical protein